MKKHCESGSDEDKTMVLSMVNMFFSKGYEPYENGRKENKLNLGMWKDWPFDVVWIKEWNHVVQ